MPSRSNKIDPGTRPCPDCGVALRHSSVSDEHPDGSPLREATPLLRMSALADHAAVDVFAIAVADTDGLAGAIAVGVDESGQLRATIGLAEDLDDDLRTDVLAFGIAMFVGETERLTSSTNGCLGIGRERRQSATKGAGHLAWHMLYTCGRDTSSATFDLMPI